MAHSSAATSFPGVAPNDEEDRSFVERLVMQTKTSSIGIVETNANEMIADSLSEEHCRARDTNFYTELYFFCYLAI
ncbi:hypothetical protein KIN20_032986 [Parelaphostrongylus tenuis]|uniref:Uncharacterized protein n=1 Tax=Parelaphostrongylus tenuis TaxID=148309 RepID=A0AAD5MQ10_PARTN|nr:hypothetical protein KIN20_007731 [Parelaphostrongylus tenuis]KAJ1371105.1 hypothetical protein KIN20_032986 [Parelaphostrongylus tenuis]